MRTLVIALKEPNKAETMNLTSLLCEMNLSGRKVLSNLRILTNERLIF